jgi:hypothetical protein
MEARCRGWLFVQPRFCLRSQDVVGCAKADTYGLEFRGHHTQFTLSAW